MAPHQHIFGFVDSGRHSRGAAVIGMISFHHPTMRLRDLILTRALKEAQHLVGFALGHARRVLARSPAIPRGVPRVSCLTPSGKAAVEVCFKETSALGIGAFAPAVERDAVRL